jgi:hypothetical protein
MGIYTGPAGVFVGLPYNSDSSVQEQELGTVMYGDNGRRYVYVKAGVSNLVAGNLLQAPAEDTADQNIAGTTTAVGATSITTASMTVTANQYAGGYVTVTVTPGLATTYRIKSHAAYSAAAATFELEEPIQVALTSTSRLDFIPCPYNGVIVAPTTLSSAVVGVAVNDITASQFGWIQVGGPCNILNDAAGALTVGAAVMPSSSVAGAVRLQSAGNTIVGRCMTGIASGENGMVILSL